VRPPVKRKTPESSKPKAPRGEHQFCAEAEYAESIFRDALGDSAASIAALKRALEAMPTYAPAIMSMGAVEYQLGRIAEGRELFQSLLSLPKNTTDIRQIIDEAGTFLTRIEAYQDGMALYRAAVKRYPEVAELWDGLGYCASHAGLHELERAVSMDPSDKLAAENLRLCMQQIARKRTGKDGNSPAARQSRIPLRSRCD